MLGSAATIFVDLDRLYKSRLSRQRSALVLGAVIAVVGADRRPLRVRAQTRRGGEGQRPPPAGHGGMLDRIDAPLFAGATAYFVIAAFGVV